MYSMSTLKSQKRSTFVKLCFAICLLAISAATAHAATYTVTNTDDSGAGSLRQAIIDANSNPGGDTIDFSVTGEIVLSGALPNLASSIFVDGPGAKSLTIRRGLGVFRIFNITSQGIVTIKGLTISGGLEFEGGGIRNEGILTVTESLVQNNRTNDGPEPYFCTNGINDAGDGGGIFNTGQLVIDHSLIMGNRTGNGGPGSEPPPFVPDDPDDQGGGVSCSVSPGPGGSGGAIANHDGNLIIRNSTVSGNRTGDGGYTSGSGTYGNGGNGGAIFSTGALTISNSTINANQLGNNARGAIFSTSSLFILQGSIVANTVGDDDIAGNVSSGDHNLVEDPGGALSGSNNITSIDPSLGPLAYNGGPTKTHALLPGSPAIDAGGPTALITDQRGTGFDRVVGGTADIGAFEVQPACSGIAFAPPVNFGVGDAPYSVTTADFNADGILDLATANITTANVSILLGNGLGGFSAAPSVGVGSSPVSVTTGDFNADGKLDLATANAGSDNISVLLGSGNGTFPAADNFATGDNPISVTTGDFDGDGKLDLATLNVISKDVSVLLGNGVGVFPTVVSSFTGYALNSVTTGDFNTDGKLDLAAANSGSDAVSVLLGDGAGKLGSANHFGVGSFPTSVAAGDFNADGKVDLATANQNSGNVSVLLGDGSGSFGTAMEFGVGDAPRSVTTGDFNADGKLDLATANGYSNDVSVLLNTCSSAPEPASITIIKDTQPNAPFEFGFAATGQIDQNFSLTDNGVVGPDRIRSGDLNLFGPTNKVTITEQSSLPGASLVAINCVSEANGGSGTNNNTINVQSRFAMIQLEEGEHVTCTFVNYIAPTATILDQPANTQYSDVVTLRSTTTSGVDPIEVGGSVEFRVDGVLVGTDATDASGVAEVSWKVDRPAGNHSVEAKYIPFGAYPGSTDTKTLTVLHEDATVTPSLDNRASVKVNTPGGTAGPITLCADIGDALDGSLGNIALAVPVTFSLTPVVPGTPPVQSLVDGELTNGQACVEFNNVPVNVYDVAITVGGEYYTGSGSSVLAVFDPTLGFTTGGGRVLNSAGNTLHFGFSFKYDKKSFKGQMLVMEHHPDGSVVRLKSNSLTSLSIVGKQAIVLGKANMLYGDGTSVGNLNFRLNVTDNGEPGSLDRFGLKTTTSAGAPIAAFSIDPLTILGGNIQVPQGAKK